MSNINSKALPTVTACYHELKRLGWEADFMVEELIKYVGEENGGLRGILMSRIRGLNKNDPRRGEQKAKDP